MTTSRIQPLRRMTLWTTLLCLVVLALMLAACGGDSGSSSSSSAPAASGSGSNSGSSQAGSSGSSSSTSAASPVTVTITEQTGGHDVYSFSPATVSIKAGDSIKFVNDSDENHLLSSDVAGVFTTSSIVTRSGSNDNTFSITFPKAGTYNVTSKLVNRLKDGQHNPDPMDSQAKLVVTVS